LEAARNVKPGVPVCPRIHDLLAAFGRTGERFLLIGGQAMRLSGMPRFSMDWDFYIPPRDLRNLARLNSLLESELDVPPVPLGPQPRLRMEA
jgi:hypothetical protein